MPPLPDNDFTYDLTDKRIWVAGETGMVGRAVTRQLQSINCQIISAPHSELDLTNQQETDDWFFSHTPHIVILAAAKVGGIAANMKNSASFLSENLSISQNVINAAKEHGVEKLIYLGSSCIYPKFAQQPIKEESLMGGALEPTNEAYALAKIAGLKLSEYYHTQHHCNFVSAMPTNLYGPYDHFHPDTSHVIPALIYKIHQAKMNNNPTVSLWGTGTPLREFLHVDDLARAIITLLRSYHAPEPINIGSSEEISIADLATLLSDIIGYKGMIQFDTAMPDGTPRKLLDSSKINALGWSAEYRLRDGLEETYQWFLDHHLL